MEAQAEVPAAPDGARTQIIQEEMSTLMERLLEELPEGARQALELQHRENLSREEIAQRLGIPLAAVHARFERSYQSLRGKLAQHFTSRIFHRGRVTWSDVERLRPSFREAVVLKHGEGLSETEGALRLGVPRKTFEARLRSAYEKLECLPHADFSDVAEEWHRRNRS